MQSHDRQKGQRCGEASVSAGHPLAADIAWDVLLAGGNMADAGIAAVLALTVLHSEQVQLGGILPALVKHADSDQVWSIEGLGCWPKTADLEHLRRNHRGRIPVGILRTVTPALPDACFTAIERFGTKTFSELAAPAQSLAELGFSAHQDLVSATTIYERHYLTNSENTSIWLPNGRPVQHGERFTQPKLAATLQRLIDADQQGGTEAARALFYEGAMAKEMIDHVAAEGGWLSADDLACHVTPITEATSGCAFSSRIYTPGPWSQGPCLIQCLQIAEALGIQNQKPTEWWHSMLEAMKLGFSERDAYYGDPNFVDVPMERLLSFEHAKALAETVGPIARPSGKDVGSGLPSLDTSVVAVVDFNGGMFVATPSDMSHDAPAVPGLGFVMSTRGGQSHADESHPACLAPGKRPRASASPFLVATEDQRWIAGGGPGADLAIQSSAMVLARHLGSGTALDAAIAAPRVFTLEPPGSSTPHLTFPRKVRGEPDLPADVFDGLEDRGHLISRSEAASAIVPSICAVEVETKTGHAQGYGDPRRLSGQMSGQST